MALTLIPIETTAPTAPAPNGSRFHANVATGEITGPADYLASPNYQRTKREIEAGTHCLIRFAPVGTPTGRLIEVILQTDYAAFLGEEQVRGWLEGCGS